MQVWPVFSHLAAAGQVEATSNPNAANPANIILSFPPHAVHPIRMDTIAKRSSNSDSRMSVSGRGDKPRRFVAPIGVTFLPP